MESWSTGLRESHGPLIADAIKEVETLTLANTEVIVNLNECLLKFMPNLKELRIWKKFNEPPKTDWMDKIYPKLNRFVWHAYEELPIDKLKRFLSNNPNTTFFSLLTNSHDTVQKLIKDGIRINELFFKLPRFFELRRTLNYSINNIPKLLDDLLVLCKQQFCRLHLNYVKRPLEFLLNVGGLLSLAPYIEGLYFGHKLDKTFAQSLVTFEHLKVLQIDIREHSDEIAAIPNLREIYVYWAVTQSNRSSTQRAMLNFAQHSKKLKKIFLRSESQEYEAEVFQQLNARRCGLLNAEKLRIYFKTENALNNIECNYDKIELLNVETEIVKNPFVNEYNTTKKFTDLTYGRFRRNRDLLMALLATIAIAIFSYSASIFCMFYSTK